MRSRLVMAAVAVAALGAATAAVVVQSAGAATAHVSRHAVRHRATRVRGVLVLREAKVHVVLNGSTVPRVVLVDAANRPVYMVTGETRLHPKCTTAACHSAWRPVTTNAKKLLLGKGVRGKLAIWRHNRLNQLMLNGHPLFTFAADSAGTASGEGINNFGGVWELFTAAGRPVPKTAPKSSSGYGGGSSGW
ncbi:MAG: hypothetical protein M0T77_14035 [Actinomycetota bacterium]|nr:hypothetical protein [Actinomycetota bacterium]